MKNLTILLVILSLGLLCVGADASFTAASAARLALSKPSSGSNTPSPQRISPRRTEPPSQVLFDDFNYSKHREMIKHGWILRRTAGWPGVP
ncbi:MAG TPA: hypothetical protein VGJ48_03230, partial [Pyrinomonadaceae bacterium]